VLRELLEVESISLVIKSARLGGLVTSNIKMTWIRSSNASWWRLWEIDRGDAQSNTGAKEDMKSCSVPWGCSR